MTKLIPLIQHIKKTKETYNINKFCDLIITKEDGVVCSEYWQNKSGIKNTNILYMTKEELEQCIKLMKNNSDFSEIANKHYLEDKKDILIEGNAKLENFYFYDSSNWMLFDSLGDVISLPYWFNYIGSISEKQPNCEIFSEIINKLLEHPYIKELIIEEIPYYNSNFSGQIGIKSCKVYLPNDVFQNLYKLKQPVPVRELLKFQGVYKDAPDIYGFKELLIKYHNQEKYYENE